MSARAPIPAPAGPAVRPLAPVLRRCACGGSAAAGGECAECRKKRLQRSPSAPASSTDTAPPAVHEVLRSPGQPLDGATRSYMEPRFGHSFGNVRVHADAGAAESASAIGARAYAVGRDVVFGAGMYRPGSADGRRLIAHELAHVVQQSGSASSPISPSLEIGATDAPEEREAEAAAQAVSEGAGVDRLPAGGIALRSSPVVRRADPGEVMRTGAMAAGVISQLDSPAPGPADAVALVVLAGAALIAGGILVFQALRGRSTTTTTTTTAPPAPPLAHLPPAVAAAAALAARVAAAGAAGALTVASVAAIADAVRTVSQAVEDAIRADPRAGMRCSSELIAFRAARDALVGALANPAQFGGIQIIRLFETWKTAVNALLACLGIEPIAW